MDFLPPPRIDLLVYSPTSSSLLSPLSTLLEPSSALTHQLVPQLHSHLQALLQTSPAALPKSYSALLDICATLVRSWDMEDQASFVNCHPRIGETKNLSEASSFEQGQTQSGNSSRSGSKTPPGTPGEVMKRLTILNSLYEESYPGLRFVTFVNGRPRSAIVPEIEGLLGLQIPAPSPSTPEPSLSSLRTRASVKITGSSAWREELQRGLDAIFDISKNRLENMGVA